MEFEEFKDLKLSQRVCSHVADIDWDNECI